MKRFRPCLTVLALSVSAFAFGQKPNFKFQPGQWQIDSTVTTSNGRSISRKTTVCAKGASDFAVSHAPNAQCDAPALSYPSNGVRVQISCHGGNGPVSWKSQTDVTELFSVDGTSFTETGKTTTTTTLPGRAPMVMSANITSHGSNTGACAK